MRKVLLMLLLGVASMACAQEMEMKPPAELAKLAFMHGEWNAKLKFTWMGQASDGTGSFKCFDSVGGRFVQADHTYDEPQMGKMHGLHLVSYDSAKKTYVGWWFDQMSSTPMEMSGNFEGNKLVMVSKPTPMEGMGDVIMRASWDKKSAKEITFKLEMKQGEKWTTMIEGVYAKK